MPPAKRRMVATHAYTSDERIVAQLRKNLLMPSTQWKQYFEQIIDSDTKDEMRLERRKEKNRMSAKRSTAMKNVKMTQMDQTIAELKLQIQQLRQENRQLVAMNKSNQSVVAYLKHRVAQAGIYSKHVELTSM